MLLKFEWAVYASWDTGLEPVALLASGTEPAGLTNDGSQVINFSGTWPPAGGDYHTIIDIDLPLDNDDNNNVVSVGYDTGPNDEISPFFGMPAASGYTEKNLPIGKLRPGE